MNVFQITALLMRIKTLHDEQKLIGSVQSTWAGSVLKLEITAQIDKADIPVDLLNLIERIAPNGKG